MADAALADLALSGVAAKAVIVCLKTDWDMPSRSRKIVTCDAALSGPRIPAIMHRMVELHIEALDKSRRERFYSRRRRLHILVTDRTHRLRLTARELAQMTADTRLVTREIHLQ